MPHVVKPKERVCSTCGKRFKGPNYLCKEKSEGEYHDVPRKEYYSPSGGLQLQWKCDRRYPDPTGQGGTVFVPGKTAQFIRGTFATTDPEEQDFMDEYPGLISREKWEETFIPEKDRNDKRARELANAKQVVDNQNEELKRLRAQLKLDPETGQPVQ